MQLQPNCLKKRWLTLALVPPLTAADRDFRAPTATITPLKQKHLHSISVAEVWCVCVLQTDPGCEPAENTSWGLRAEICSRGVNTASEETFVLSLLAREEEQERGNWAEIIGYEGSEQRYWARRGKTVLFSSNDFSEKDDGLDKYERRGPVSFIWKQLKKPVVILCWHDGRTAVGTQAKAELGYGSLSFNLYSGFSLSSSILCPLFPAFSFPFHSVQPTFFAICATLFVLSFSLPCFAFLLLSLHPPFCYHFPTSLQPLRLFDPSLFPPSLPALSLAGHPHFLQYARGWDRERESGGGQREGEQDL